LDAPEGETAWGNPEITVGLINAVAAAGFDLVRIPVTYSLRTGAGPDYVIEASYLQRIAEVVDWVTSAGMLALINIHHDGADAYGGEVEWLSLNDSTGAITDANNQAVQARFVALWTQIASHFQPYGEALLFESMNEIHDGYDAPDPQYYTIINNLNQAFVDTVRGTGGNNVMRHLVVPGYNTNIDYTLQGFVAPTDPTPNHLILSVHYYDPWSFAGEGSTNTWGAGQPGADTWGQEDFVRTQFDALSNTFVSAGLPMIIGEYGAVHQTGYEDYRRYYMEYVTRAAVERGIVPVYWDNGSQESGAEAFGLFNRNTNEVLYPNILEAMMRAADGAIGLNEIAPPSP
jgi:endoglucanase